MRCQLPLAADGIEVNVPTDVPVIAFIFDQLSRGSALVTSGLAYDDAALTNWHNRIGTAACHVKDWDGECAGTSADGSASSSTPRRANRIAPHHPKPAAVIHQIVMLVDALRLSHIAHHRVLTCNSRQTGKFYLSRIIKDPGTDEHPRTVTPNMFDWLVSLNDRSQLREGEAPAEPAVRREPHPPFPRIALGHWGVPCRASCDAGTIPIGL